MRVALACPYAWDTPGGVQVHVRGLADALARRGHGVMILTPASGPVPEDDVHVVGRPIRIPYGGKVAPITPSHASWRRVREALRVFEPDVVHVHEPFSPSTSMFATLSSEDPVVATFHAYHERSRLLRVAAPLLRQVASRITAPVAVSEAAAAFVAGVVRAPVEIVPNGVDVGRFEAPADPAPEMPPRPVMLWASRLDRQKGFPIAVRAFVELLRAFDDLSFAVVGAGADAGAIDTLPEAVRERVRMLGAVPNSELHRFHAGADVYVAPATGHESFGVILVEAMAAGVPVVATDIPGYREVIRDGVDGALVRPGDPHALAVAVGRVLGDRDLRERLRANGRERARAYGWDAVVPSVEAIYERVAGGRPERLG
jgi:phosphatidylinositol alpha-mannosyltransferase